MTTVEEIQRQILLEIGDVDSTNGDPLPPGEDGLLADNMADVWDRWAFKARTFGGLQPLYVKRSLIRMVLAVLNQRRFDVADTQAGVQNKFNQTWDHYNSLYECVKAEIKAMYESISASGGYRTGRIKKTAPVMAPYPPDGNRMRYGGSIYGRRRVRRL